MTLEQFEQFGTPTGNIAFLYNPLPGGLYAISASNISTTACGFVDVTDSLEELATAQFTFNGEIYEAEILSSVNKEQYYFFRLQPFIIPAQLDTLTCTQVLLTPSIGTVGFANSDYNAIFNNAVDIRESGVIQDVDRKRNQVLPANLDAILTDTAPKAQIQDSNYTSIGHTNSKYNGAKTSEDTYGVESALVGSIADASVHSILTSFNTICSQSVGARTVEEILFSPDMRAIGASTAEYPSVRYQQLGDFVTGFSMTNFELTLNFPTLLEVEAGDIIRLGFVYLRLDEEVHPYEHMYVEEVISQSTTSTVVKVIRRYGIEYDPAMSSTLFYSNDKVYVYRVVGDRIFKTDKNQLYQITEKLIWVQSIGKVLYVDPKGNILSTCLTCTT